MRYVPLSSYREMMAEYDARCIENLRKEQSTRRVPFALVALTFWVGFQLLCAGFVAYNEYQNDEDRKAQVEQMGY